MILEERNVLYCIVKHSNHDNTERDCGFLHHHLDFLSADFDLHAFLLFLQTCSTRTEQILSVYAVIDFSVWAKLLCYLGAPYYFNECLKEVATTMKWKHAVTSYNAYTHYGAANVCDECVVRNLDLHAFMHTPKFWRYKTEFGCGYDLVKTRHSLNVLDKICIPKSVYAFLNRTRAMLAGPCCVTAFDLMLPCMQVDITVKNKIVMLELVECLQHEAYTIVNQSAQKQLAIAPVDSTLRNIFIYVSSIPLVKVYELHCDQAYMFISDSGTKVVRQSTCFANLAWQNKSCFDGYHQNFMLKDNFLTNVVQRNLCALHIPAWMYEFILRVFPQFPLPDSAKQPFMQKITITSSSSNKRRRSALL